MMFKITCSNLKFAIFDIMINLSIYIKVILHSWSHFNAHFLLGFLLADAEAVCGLLLTTLLSSLVTLVGGLVLLDPAAGVEWIAAAGFLALRTFFFLFESVFLAWEGLEEGTATF